MKKFWNWVKSPSNDGDTETSKLYLNGPIADETWWGDEITPEQFRLELEAHAGDIEVWINSPGGDVFAAAQIYDMLMEHKGHVKVMIDSLAASAASVIALAGTEVLISPPGMIMIHNPATGAWGDHTEMQKAIDVLNEVKESIINAYQLKTGMSRQKLARLMDDETWMNARKAVELGFADKIAFSNNGNEREAEDAVMFGNKSFNQKVINKASSFRHVTSKHGTAKADKYYDRLYALRANF